MPATGNSDPDDNIDNDSNVSLGPVNGASSKAITLAYNTEPTAGTGNDTNNTLDLGFTPILADLQITKDDGVTTKIAGTSTIYTIVVTNAGPNAVAGATVADTFDFARFSTVTWSSVAAGGATGNTASSNRCDDSRCRRSESANCSAVASSTAPAAGPPALLTKM